MTKSLTFNKFSKNFWSELNSHDVPMEYVKTRGSLYLK